MGACARFVEHAVACASLRGKNRGGAGKNTHTFPLKARKVHFGKHKLGFIGSLKILSKMARRRLAIFSDTLLPWRSDQYPSKSASGSIVTTAALINGMCSMRSATLNGLCN